MDHPSSDDRDDWNPHLTAMARGDRRAFETLFREFAPRLKAFALSTRGVSAPAAFADELVQDVMLTLWRKANRFDPSKASATTWIFTIARNRRIDLLRRHNRDASRLTSEDLWPEAEDTEHDPFTRAQEDRTRAHLRTALSGLPTEQAEVIGKVFLQGLTHSEVAEELGIPLGTVKSRLRLALKKLKLEVETLTA